MKDRKSLLFILPILVFLGTFLVIRVLDNRSFAATDTVSSVAIPEGAIFRYPKRSNGANDTSNGHNFYSHYYVSDNKSWEVGLKKITSDEQYGGSNVSVSVYCAEQGHSISTGKHYRYALNNETLKVNSDSNKNAEIKQKLNKMMKYAYPFSTLSQLKTSLQDPTVGIGSLYASLGFADMKAQEAVTATQAAIWNIIKSTNKYEYGGFHSGVSGFNDCEGYYKDGKRVITSEEEAWYAEALAAYGNGCDPRGNFYKWVYSSKEANSAEKEAAKLRINALITWYTTTLQTTATDTSDTFTFASNPIFTSTGDTYTAQVTFNTNISDYSIVFKNIEGTDITTLGANVAKSGNTYTLTNIPKTSKTIRIEVVSNSTNKTVYWYTGSGQDFIGAESSSKNPFSLEMSYEEQPGTALLYKVTGASQEVEVVNGRRDNACGGTGQPTCLSGAKFALYYGNKTTVKQYIIIENGKFEVNNLATGTYYLKEIQPPLGYDFYSYGQGAVDSEGYIRFDITDGNTVTVIANNQPTNICIKKVSNTAPNEVLEGAKLVIEDEDGQVFESFTSSKQDQSGSNGTHCVSKLPVGSYYVTETEAPVGFSLPAKSVEFNVGKVNNVATSLVTVTNRKGLTMSKSDLTDGECVTGALLIIKNSSGQEVTRWTSTCSGNDEEGEDSHTVPICITQEEQNSYASNNTDCLKPGKYTLTEEIHPEGYATAETIEFEIDSNGKVIGDANMKDAPIEVCIYKVKKGTKEVLTGAEFEIYKKGSAELYTKITSSKEPCIPYFPVGEYVIKETKAPDGYKLPENNETTIVVEDKAGHQDFYIENEIVAPKTAMDYSVTVVIIASVFLMFGIGLVGYYEYKKGH